MIYAKQVPPDLQESPLFTDGCFPDNIAVFGNRSYKERIPEVVENVRKVLKDGELADILETGKSEWFKNVTEAICEFLPPLNGKRYSTNHIHALRNLVIDFSCCVCSKENEILCKVLSIVTGKTWDYRTITGSCQSDWNEMFYQVDEWTDRGLKIFEKEYFNEGSEWIIHDEDYAPESAEDVSGYSIYCCEWDIDDIKKEIAEYTDSKPEDVVLYAFKDYMRVAIYDKL